MQQAWRHPAGSRGCTVHDGVHSSGGSLLRPWSAALGVWWGAWLGPAVTAGQVDPSTACCRLSSLSCTVRWVTAGRQPHVPCHVGRGDIPAQRSGGVAPEGASTVLAEGWMARRCHGCVQVRLAGQLPCMSPAVGAACGSVAWHGCSQGYPAHAGRPSVLHSGGWCPWPCPVVPLGPLWVPCQASGSAAGGVRGGMCVPCRHVGCCRRVGWQHACVLRVTSLLQEEQGTVCVAGSMGCSCQA
jgi:hypothetical protein